MSHTNVQNPLNVFDGNPDTFAVMPYSSKLLVNLDKVYPIREEFSISITAQTINRTSPTKLVVSTVRPGQTVASSVRDLWVPITKTTMTVTFPANTVYADVGRFLLEKDNIQAGYVRIYSIGVVDVTPPVQPTGLTLTPQTSAVRLDWQANPDNDVQGYTVYRNLTKITPNLINGLTFTDTTAVPDEVYTYHITATDYSGNESIKSVSATGAAMMPEQIPKLTISAITDTTLRLNWDNVAPKFEIYQDDVLLTKPDTHVKLYDVQGLEPDTQYRYRIIAIDKYGRRVPSDLVTIRTTRSVPTKPVVTVTDITHKSARVYWAATKYTNNYSVYLDDDLQQTTNDLTYTFSNLDAQKIYRVKVVSNGTDLTAETTLSFTTLRTPVPTITGASIKAAPASTIPPGGGSGGSNTKRELTYQASDDVTGVNVYVNGKLIGTYPADQKKIELDFADLDGIMADVKIEPVDPDGQAYEFQSPVASAGDASLDIILAEFFRGLGIQRNGFLYLAIIGIPLLILVAIFFFVRARFKRMLKDGSENKPAGVVNAENPQAINAAGKKFAIDGTPDERKKYQKPERDAEYIRRGSPKWQGFTVADVKHRNVAVGFMGMGGIKTVKDVTYERNGVLYKNRYVKGQGRVMVPKDTRNQIKHMSNQFTAFKQVFGSNKKIPNGISGGKKR